MRWLLRSLAITSVPLGNVDVVHASMAGLAGVPGVLHKRLRGVPFVITEHGIYLRELYIVLAKLPQLKACRRFLLMLADAVVRMNYEHADVVTSLCEFNRKWQKRVGCQRPTVTTPNGADPEIFRPREGGEPATPVILTLARIFRLKGVDVLLKAVPRVCEAIPGVKVRILGDVADEVYFEECMEIVRAHNLQASVEFGKTSKPADALRQATVACIPSISEAFPFALVEAMLCGCPIVASDVGGIAEVLGETGLIFGSRDHDDLASALIFMLDQSPEGAARRAGYGEAARARALASYTMAGAIGRFEAIYSAAIKGDQSGAHELVEANCTSGTPA
jgi:glycosyltransferase involved in cell wall biosynthesis